VHRPLIPVAAFLQAPVPQVIDLDLSAVDPLLALMVTMRTGTLADAHDIPEDLPQLVPPEIPGRCGLRTMYLVVHAVRGTPVC
jgi:hypothetical protein